jgi:hypothetical protein
MTDNNLVFYDYEYFKVIRIKQIKSGCTSLGFSGAYKVILYGTEDYTIQKIDLNDILQYKSTYDENNKIQECDNSSSFINKYHFMANKKNYEFSTGKYILIIKLLEVKDYNIVTTLLHEVTKKPTKEQIQASVDEKRKKCKLKERINKLIHKND